MEMLAALFVGQPLHIGAVALAFGIGYAIVSAARRGQRSAARWLLIAAVLWGLYAAWEWVVITETPEANIRVDLLLIWPVLGLVSLFALYRACRR